MLKFNERLGSRSILTLLFCLILTGTFSTENLSAQRIGARRATRNRSVQTIPQTINNLPNELPNDSVFSDDSRYGGKTPETASLNTPNVSAIESENLSTDTLLENVLQQKDSELLRSEQIFDEKNIQELNVPEQKQTRKVTGSKNIGNQNTESQTPPELAFADTDFLSSENEISTKETLPADNPENTQRQSTITEDQALQALAESLSSAENSPSSDTAKKGFEFEPTQNASQEKPMRCFWFTNWNEARAAVLETGRPLLIHFGTEYCPPCRQMEKTVFSQEAVQVLAGAYFVAVKVDGSRNQKLCENFNVGQFPTDIIVTPAGNVLARHTGFQNATQYSSFLTLAAAKVQLPALRSPIGPDWRATVGKSQVPASEKLEQNLAATALNANRKKESESPEENNSMFQNQLHSQTEEQVEDLLEAPALAAAAPNKNQSGETFNESEEMEEEPLDLLSLPEKNSAEIGSASEITDEDENTLDLLSMETRDQAREIIPDLEENSMRVEPLDAPLSDLNLTSAEHAADETESPNSFLHRTAYSTEINSPIPTLMDGYCPVAMVERNTWVLGNSQITCLYGNGRYCFENEEAQEKFFRDPAFYALVSDGMDIVLLTDQNHKSPGTRRLGIRYANLNFVFATEESQQKFRQNPDLYLKRAREQIAKEHEPSKR